MKNEDYDISITGKQFLDGETDEINLKTVGSYRKKGDTRYISYKEYYNGHPSLSCISVLTVEPDKVTVAYGNSSTHLILEEGKRHLCLYDTEVGSLTLGIFTSTMENLLDSDGGSLHVEYTMDINHSLSSCHEINVDVRRRPKS